MIPPHPPLEIKLRKLTSYLSAVLLLLNTLVLILSHNTLALPPMKLIGSDRQRRRRTREEEEGGGGWLGCEEMMGSGEERRGESSCWCQRMDGALRWGSITGRSLPKKKFLKKNRAFTKDDCGDALQRLFFLIIIDYQYLAAFHTQRKRNVRRCVRWHSGLKRGEFMIHEYVNEMRVSINGTCSSNQSDTSYLAHVILWGLSKTSISIRFSKCPVRSWHLSFILPGMFTICFIRTPWLRQQP